MRTELRALIDEVLRATPAGGAITLDALGERMGKRAFSTDEIDAAIEAIEATGRRVEGPEGGGGAERLRRVLEAARSLRAASGRAPTVAEIAARSGLDEAAVKAALALGRVMGR